MKSARIGDNVNTKREGTIENGYNSLSSLHTFPFATCNLQSAKKERAKLPVLPYPNLTPPPRPLPLPSDPADVAPSFSSGPVLWPWYGYPQNLNVFARRNRTRDCLV